jgi:two-component system CheB/CheR fusion protein
MQKTNKVPKQKKQKIAVKPRNVSSLQEDISQRQNSFPIIAIGGSAGSIQAFEKFFTHMPADSGMGFVIIMHLDPDQPGSVASIIQTYTPIPVIEAEDGVFVKRDHIYIIPPNKDMGIHNRQLLLLTPSKPKGYRMPIDYFFQSLADDQWSKAVAIIFSGMGSDGETGVRLIKEKLGMSMVQDPEVAQYSSMPKSAISTNMVDYVLSPEEMPIKLIQYLKHPALNDESEGHAITDSKNNNAIQKILMMLRSQTGHDFSLYKKNTITRRIDRRIAFHQLPDYSQYVTHLRENPSEINTLFNELLIGVTKFFRDTAAFDSLRERLFILLKDKLPSEPIRVWIAGCSTGEEAYSVAILLMEFLETLKGKKSPKVQIFATDLDGEAIEHARQGIYLENIVAEMSPQRIEKYFTKTNDCYVVKKELREMIVFAQHNLIKDAPFTRLELLVCRNLMIYLTTDLQKKIIPIFHYSLNDKGLLFLGPAETISGYSDLFQSVDPKWKIFERKLGIPIPTRIIDFPFNIAVPQGLMPMKVETGKFLKKVSLQEMFNKLLLDNYTPTSVLINEKGDILYINGKTGKYLELSSGEAATNVYRLIREELKYALSNAIHQARNQKGIVTIKDIKLKEHGYNNLVNLKVAYIEHSPLQNLVLIIFEDKGTEEISNKKGKKSEQPQEAVVEELEKELSYTKQQLHNTIEQMETSLEELKSTNEELQSTNEELQSTNEESLTTKEEMQSLNEELMTINMQYQSKAEELTQLNNDMKNMLDNTDIGTIFLDNNLDILRFTPQVNKLFNVIQGDIGRPITHVVSNFEYAELETEIRKVIEKLSVKEVQVKTKKNDWYNLRIMPYRTLDNFINGAVLTFHNITRLKNLENQVEDVQDILKTFIESLDYPALIVDRKYHVLFLNTSFIITFKARKQDFMNITFKEYVHAEWKNPQLEKLLKPDTDEEFSVKIEHPYEKDHKIVFDCSVKPIIKGKTMKLISMKQIS